MDLLLCMDNRPEIPAIALLSERHLYCYIDMLRSQGMASLLALIINHLFPALVQALHFGKKVHLKLMLFSYGDTSI